MSRIKYWREAAMLTQAQMAAEFEMPKRTLENWEEGSRQPSAWVEKLIIEKLMRITEEKYEAWAKKASNKLKSDEDGNRPEIAWVTIETIRGDEFIQRFDNLADAYHDADDGVQVACLIVNKGKADYYMDRDGEVFCNYNGFEKN